MLLCRQAFWVVLSQTTGLALSEIRLVLAEPKGMLRWSGAGNTQADTSNILNNPHIWRLNFRPHRPVSPQPSILSFVSLSHSSFNPKSFSPAVRGPS